MSETWSNLRRPALAAILSLGLATTGCSGGGSSGSGPGTPSAGTGGLTVDSLTIHPLAYQGHEVLVGFRLAAEARRRDVPVLLELRPFDPGTQMLEDIRPALGEDGSGIIAREEIPLVEPGPGSDEFRAYRIPMEVAPGTYAVVLLLGDGGRAWRVAPVPLEVAAPDLPDLRILEATPLRRTFSVHEPQPVDHGDDHDPETGEEEWEGILKVNLVSESRSVDVEGPVELGASLGIPDPEGSITWFPLLLLDRASGPGVPLGERLTLDPIPGGTVAFEAGDHRGTVLELEWTMDIVQALQDRLEDVECRLRITLDPDHRVPQWRDMREDDRITLPLIHLGPLGMVASGGTSVGSPAGSLAGTEPLPPPAEEGITVQALLPGDRLSPYNHYGMTLLQPGRSDYYGTSGRLNANYDLQARLTSGPSPGYQQPVVSGETVTVQIPGLNRVWSSRSNLVMTGEDMGCTEGFQITLHGSSRIDFPSAGGHSMALALPAGGPSGTVRSPWPFTLASFSFQKTARIQGKCTPTQAPSWVRMKRQPFVYRTPFSKVSIIEVATLATTTTASDRGYFLIRPLDGPTLRHGAPLEIRWLDPGSLAAIPVSFNLLPYSTDFSLLPIPWVSSTFDPTGMRLAPMSGPTAGMKFYTKGTFQAFTLGKGAVDLKAEAAAEVDAHDILNSYFDYRVVLNGTQRAGRWYAATKNGVLYDAGSNLRYSVASTPAKATVTLGPVPITLRAWVEGTAGMNVLVRVEPGNKVNASAGPYVATAGRASASYDAGVAEVGIAGSLTLLRVDMKFIGVMQIDPITLAGTAYMAAPLTFSSMDGRIYLFASWNLLFSRGSEQWNLAGWTGWTSTFDIVPARCWNLGDL